MSNHLHYTPDREGMLDKGKKEKGKGKNKKNSSYVVMFYVD